jgi:hypothetical protein
MNKIKTRNHLFNHRRLGLHLPFLHLTWHFFSTLAVRTNSLTPLLTTIRHLLLLWYSTLYFLTSIYLPLKTLEDDTRAVSSGGVNISHSEPTSRRRRRPLGIHVWCRQRLHWVATQYRVLCAGRRSGIPMCFTPTSPLWWLNEQLSAAVL